ncbi:MAG: hypothetical protein ACRDKE_11310 [Solirubrobacterales bacterium]
MKIHHNTKGPNRWTTEVVMDLDAAEGRAQMLCASAMKDGKEITVLFDHRGKVDRAMLTFGDSPDDEPYIGYRGVEEPLPVDDAKHLAALGDIKLSEPLGNFLP